MKQLLLLSVFICAAAILNAQKNASDYRFNGEQAVFTENQGQVVDMDGKPVPDVLAKASMPGLDMYLTKTGVTYMLLQYTEDLTAKPHPVFFHDKKYKITYSRVDVALTGAVISNEQMQLTGDAGWQSNYYKSDDGKGQLAVQHFKNLTVQNVYPGIDWVWKFNTAGKLEYDFVVHPGADPSLIKMQYSYADLTQKGNNLIIGTRIGSLTEGPLQASCSNSKVQIAYNLEAKSKTISFSATGYDKTKDLLIDPPLALNWSAQFGGSFLNGLRGVATDTLGGIYLCGYTTSPTFVTRNPHINGAYFDSTYNGQSDVILIKLDTNQNMKWATYMGGPNNDFANSVCYSILNNEIYITGGAGAGFPVIGTGSSSSVTGQDAFVAIFTNTLALKYSSFYGGNGTDEGLKICTDNNYFVYVSGYTNSTNNSFASYNYPGGYNQTTVTGVEAFIMAFAANSYNPNILWWSTKYGGNGDDYATAITTDSAHNLVVAGFTTSTNIPLLQSDSAYYQNTNRGGTDGFILKFNSYNHSLMNATYYGGSGNDYFTDVATGYKSNFDFTGRTNSPNFPLRNINGYGYYQAHLADTTGDAFIVKCANNMTMKWSTYYGGNALDAGTGIATDAAGQMYVSGFTFSTNFPVDSFAGAFYQPVNHGNSDGFIARFTDLGVRSWSTYKGDSCYQYPYDIAYDRKFNKFYVAGEGLLACGQSLPDSGEVINGTSSIGFCWGFNGQTTPPCTGFGIGVTYTVQPCPGQCNGVATASAAGGHMPYHYIWSNGVDSATSNNLCAAEGWVEVKDSMGCFAEAELSFNPLSVITQPGYIACLPGPATISAIASGGNAGTDLYQWSTLPGVYTDSAFTFASDTGTYTVTAEDSKGCTASGTASVFFANNYPNGQPEIIQYPSCGNNGDGVVTLDFQGTDSIFPLGNVIWEDVNGNVLATGDTFYNASTLQQYYAVDSGYCFNGVTSPYFFSVYLDNSTDLAQLVPTVVPSTCLNLGGQASVQFSEQSFGITGTAPNNNYYYGNNMNVDNYPNDFFQWSDGEQGQAAVSLGIGPYNVTVTDNGCVTVLNGYFNAPPGPTVLPVVDSAYCNGGFIDLSNTYGGEGSPYTYQWPDGGTNSSEQNLPVGAYAVTITDAGGCADTLNVYLPQGTPLSANATGSSPLCFGGNGTLTVTGSGGVPPYGGTGTFADPAGTYNITVADNDGCTATASATITQPSTIIVTANLISGSGCGGGATYNVAATGGTPPYTGTGTQSEPIGSDVITVTDANGCTGNTTVVVHPSGNAIIPNNTYTPILCYGDTTTLTITATGGNGPITGTGVFTETAGTYYFTISDSAGCSVGDTVVITEPALLSVSLSSAGITCSPGSITASVTGGTPNYQFEWSTSPGFGDSSSILVMQPGFYYVTVQDANLCTVINYAYADYNNAPATIDSITVYQWPSCGLSNGVLFINAVDPSKISWLQPDGTITYGDTLRNVPTSTSNQSIIITDSSNCLGGEPISVQYLVTLATPTYGTSTTTFAPSGCNTRDGFVSTLNDFNTIKLAQVIINNQLPYDLIGLNILNYAPLTYQWSNGFTYTVSTDSIPWTEYFNGDTNIIGYGGSLFDSLNPGTYSITVTDGTCKYIDTVVLTPSHPPLIVDYTITSPNCNGDASGVIKLAGFKNDSIIPVFSNLNDSVSYLPDSINNYLWSNGDTTPSINHLAAGTYFVTITGPNACPVIDTFNIVPSAFHLVIRDTITPAICYNGNATVVVTATGGTSPYTGTGNLIEAPGTQILTVTDSNGCVAKDTISVPHGSGSPIIATNTFTPILCHGDTTTLTITATGGNGPIAGTGVFTETAGTYYFTISDSAGCSVVDTVVIGQPAQLSVSLNSAGITCSPGSVTASVAGGTPNYQFEWSTSQGFGDSSIILVGLAGNYYVTVQDVNACTALGAINVGYNNFPLTLDSIIILQFPACGLNNGIVYIQAADPSKISWTVPGGSVFYGDTLFNAPIDANSNDWNNSLTTISSSTILITDSSQCMNGIVAPVQYQLSILPNLANINGVTGFSPPLTTPQNPYGCNGEDGYIQNTLTNWTQVYTNLNNQGWNQISEYGSGDPLPVINPSPVIYKWSTGLIDTISPTWVNYWSFGAGPVNLSAGTYTVTVTDGTCQVIDTVVLTPTAPPLTTNYTITYPVCNGNNSGQIILTGDANNYPNIYGDTTNTFRWSNGDTTASINHLTTGTYTVTITGPNACPVLDTFRLTAPQTVLEHDSVIQPLCSGGTATIIVTATGGTLPYNGTGTLFKPAGTYVLIVTDSNGCTASDTVTVTPSGHSSIVIATNATPILCNGGYATLSVNASGGVAPYTGTGTFSKPAGDYVITVSDNAGCSAADTIDITQPLALRVTKQVNTIPCFGDSATITLTAQGGTAPYAGLGTFKKPAGNYVFVVTDNKGCSSADSVSLTQPSRLTLTDTVSRINCFGGNATVVLTASGGTGPYYGTGTLQQPAGNDVLIVSDQNGCTDSVNLNITQPSQVTINVQLPDSAIRCADTLKAIITATGGTGNYTGTGSINYTQSGTYTIHVTDGSGCTVDTSVHITLDTCTGVETVLDNTGIMLYPNPASDKFYVKFLTALTAPADIRLYAVDGKLVMLKTLGAGTDITEIDCNQLASGVYILHTVVMNKEYNFKVVVTR